MKYSHIEKIANESPELTNIEIVELLEDDPTLLSAQEAVFNGTIKLAFSVLTKCQLDIDEFISLAWSACQKACEAYNPNFKTKFSSFYVTIIKQTLSKHFTKQSARSGKLDICCSLDQRIGEDDNTIGNLIPDNTDVEKDVHVREELEIAYKILDSLSDREKDIILRRNNGEMYKSIGNDYGLSRQRIQQIDEGARSLIKGMSKNWKG